MGSYGTSALTWRSEPKVVPGAHGLMTPLPTSPAPRAPVLLFLLWDLCRCVLSVFLGFIWNLYFFFIAQVVRGVWSMGNCVCGKFVVNGGSDKVGVATLVPFFFYRKK